MLHNFKHLSFRNRLIAAGLFLGLAVLGAAMMLTH